ncbi:MAG TPA: hypothetical protein VEZ40_22285 [Pyrinomonadaceae bacterium]|nr:hypothetical protein [Pyrinomonadaceae bacterium]
MFAAIIPLESQLFAANRRRSHKSRLLAPVILFLQLGETNIRNHYIRRVRLTVLPAGFGRDAFQQPRMFEQRGLRRGVISAVILPVSVFTVGGYGYQVLSLKAGSFTQRTVREDAAYNADQKRSHDCRQLGDFSHARFRLPMLREKELTF